MAGYRKNNNDGPSAEDKALDLFAEMMIDRIETISKDWKSRGSPRAVWGGRRTCRDVNTTG